MKKILLAFIILLIGINAHAFTTVSGRPYPGGAAASSCPSGTYKFAWNGDYSGDTDKGCFNSGGSTKDGTQTNGTIGASYGQSGNGFRKTANDQNIKWAVSSDDGFDDEVGSLYVSAKITDDGTDTEIVLFEAGGDASNYFKLAITADRHLICAHRTGGSTTTASSTDTITEGSFVRLGCAWNAATDKVSVKVGAGTWKDNESGTVSPSGTDFTTIGIGESSLGGTENDTTDIDDVFVIGTYEGTDPL